MNANSERPIILVHGLLGTLQTPDLLQYFRAGRALAPDMLGYGALNDVLPDRITIPAQVEHLHKVIERHYGAEPIHAVGHSVGGVIAMLYAHAYPEQIESVVSVEGNFTLKDAFWSSSVASMPLPDVERMLEGFRESPAAWLESSGIAADVDNLRVAAQQLTHQPATTVWAVAQSLVEVTDSPEYLSKVRAVFERHPVHLVAGERSVGSWDIQDWARSLAASVTVIPNTGHLMMLEQPARFATLVANLVRAN